MYHKVVYFFRVTSIFFQVSLLKRKNLHRNLSQNFLSSRFLAQGLISKLKGVNLRPVNRAKT